MNFRTIRSALTDPVWQSWGAVVVTLLVLAGTGMFYLWPTISRSLVNAADLQVSAAKHVQDLLDVDLTFTFSELDQFAGDSVLAPDMQKASVEGASFLHATGFISFLILDAQGKLILHGGSEATSTLLGSYADKLFFKQALAGELYISPVYLSPTGPMLRIAEPIMQGGRIVGVSSGEIGVALLWNVVDRVAVPDGKAYIVDAIGTIIADKDLTRSSSGENLQYRDIVRRLTAGEATVTLVSYVNENKVSVVASGIRMPQTGWGVIVEQSQAQAFRERDQTTTIAWGFGLAAFALVCMLVIATLRLTRTNRLLIRDREIIESERNTSQQVISGVTDAVIAVDVSRSIITFNPAAEELTGRLAAEVIGTSLHRLLTLFEDGEIIPVEQFCPVDGKSRFRARDLRLATPKGEAFVDVVASSIPSGEHSSIGCILTLHDVTKERRLEKLKTDFVAVAAHQMRTPLTGIKWALALILDEGRGTLTEELTAFLTRAMKTTENLIEIVNNMLDVDKIEFEMLQFRKKPVDLVDIIAAVVADVTDEATAKKTVFSFEKRAAEVIVDVDVEQTKMAVRNLLDNAIKYTPEDGTVRIMIEKQGPLAVVSVTDSGIGIPKEEQANIFERFFRASNATQQETAGSGLGLFLVKTIIDREGGKIWFESEVGKGTTFYISLPITSKIS